MARTKGSKDKKVGGRKIRRPVDAVGWLIQYGQPGDVVYTDLPDRNVTSRVSAYRHRKLVVTTERLVGVSSHDPSLPNAQLVRVTVKEVIEK